MPRVDWSARGFVAAACLHCASATVNVLNASDHWPRLSFPSSTFVFYGPRPGYWVSAPGLYLTAAQMCKPDPETVRGKVAVTQGYVTACLLEDLYLALDDAGAAAFVILVRAGAVIFIALRAETATVFPATVAPQFFIHARRLPHCGPRHLPLLNFRLFGTLRRFHGPRPAFGLSGTTSGTRTPTATAPCLW